MKKVFAILTLCSTLVVLGQVPPSDGPQFQTKAQTNSGANISNKATVVCNPLSVTGNTMTPCHSGSTIFSVSGGGCGYRWYSDSLYTNKIGWEDSLVTPTLYNDSIFYVRSMCPSTAAIDSLTPLPAHVGIYSGNVRGYYFTAPCDIIITGLYVPKEASSGSSNVEVLLFDNDTPPPLYNGTTNAFKSLGYFSHYSLSDTIPVCFYVDSGEVVGIYGNRANVNSYADSPYQSMINGIPTTFTRSGMQLPLGSNQMQNVFMEAIGSIARIFFTYTVDMDTSVAQTNFVVPQSYNINYTPSICQGDSIFLEGSFQTTAGNYVDTLQSVYGCDSIISSLLSVNSLPTISGTLNICIGSTTQLTGSAPTAGSSWSSTSPGIMTVSATGLIAGVSAGTSVITYSNGNGCDIIETVIIDPNLLPTFSQLGPYCVDETPGPLPTTSTNGATGTWNTTISTVVNGTITYTFTPFSGCFTAATMDVLVTEDSLVTYEVVNESCRGGNNGAIYIRDLLRCSSPYTTVISALNSTTVLSFTALGSGEYDVKITGANDCVITTKIAVGLDSEDDCTLKFYSGLTPNGDGLNDLWVIDNIELFSENKVQIFSRWGEEVWSGKNYNNVDVVWEGLNKNGNKMIEATYFYVVEINGQIYKGWVEITR